MDRRRAAADWRVADENVDKIEKNKSEGRMENGYLQMVHCNEIFPCELDGDTQCGTAEGSGRLIPVVRYW